jgi:hypothetical protein
VCRSTMHRNPFRVAGWFKLASWIAGTAVIQLSQATGRSSIEGDVRDEIQKINDGTRARCHLYSGMWEAGAPGEIRTPDPQIRSLVLYPAELRARRVLAIGFGAYWQAPADVAGRQGSRRTGAAAAGIIARMTGRRREIFLGRGLFAKALAESVDEKSDDNKEADPADNSRRKHRRLNLDVYIRRFT